MLALFLLYGIFNLRTQCNFMRWFHRNLRFTSGMPTPDTQRSFARISRVLAVSARVSDLQYNHIAGVRCRNLPDLYGPAACANVGRAVIR